MYKMKKRKTIMDCIVCDKNRGYLVDDHRIPFVVYCDQENCMLYQEAMKTYGESTKEICPFCDNVIETY